MPLPVKSNLLCSKRAQILVDLCENVTSPSTSEVASPLSSCFTISPVPSWWDNIFEASDIRPNSHNSVNFPSGNNINSAKRKLSFSPVKGFTSLERRVTASNLRPNDSTPLLQAPAVISKATPIRKSDTDLTDIALDTKEKLAIRESDRNQLDVAEVPHVYSGTESCHIAEELSNQSEALDLELSDSLETSPNLLHSCDTITGLYPSQIKIMAAKSALNAGKEHITVRGTLKKARAPKPTCKNTCKRCARPKLTESERLVVNDEFWSLKEHVKQWNFIHNSVSCAAPKLKSSVSGAKGEKLSSRAYYLSVCGTRKRVCKTMYKNTLNICDSWVDSALSHFSNGEMQCDRRGMKKIV